MTAYNQGSLIGWPGSLIDGGAITVGTATMNNAANKVAWVFQLPEAVTINALFFNCFSVTAPPVYSLSVQGVDLTTGFPDGTIKGGGSPVSGTFTPTITPTFVSTANNYAGTRGEFIAIVGEYSSGTIGASNTCSIRYNSSFFGAPGIAAAGLINTTGTWVKSATHGCFFGFRTTSGATYGLPIAAPTARTSSATAEVGVKFRFNSGMGTTGKLAGVRWRGGSWPTGNTVWVTLYNGTTVLQQVGLSSDLALAVNSASHNNNWAIFPDATLATLDFGSYYYIGICGTAARTSALQTFDVPTAADLSAFTGSSDAFYANRTLGTAVTSGAGPTSGDASWTDTPTSRPFVYPVFSDWTISGGGGGGGSTTIVRRNTFVRR
jgi:hypothetical protein